MLHLKTSIKVISVFKVISLKELGYYVLNASQLPPPPQKWIIQFFCSAGAKKKEEKKCVIFLTSGLSKQT